MVCAERDLKDYPFPALCCKTSQASTEVPGGQFGDHGGTEICTSAHRLNLECGPSKT